MLIPNKEIWFDLINTLRKYWGILADKHEWLSMNWTALKWPRVYSQPLSDANMPQFKADTSG